MAAKKKTRVVAPSQSNPCAPLDDAAFLSAAQRVLAVLRDDLLTRADESLGVTEALKAQWEVEKAAKRTGDPWEVWRRRVVVQVAAAWVLSLVFARTLEDRGLLERNRIAGPGAADGQEQFRAIAPYLSDRDYLLTVFEELSNLPAAKDLFDPAHNPVWKLGPSTAGARALLDLFRAPDPEAPAFRFGQSNTDFLGNLYQDLDQETQERFALLQTPPFVQSFILDQTLEPAIHEFGLDGTTVIDPTCGSGHFLLGAFARLVDHRLREQPGTDAREAAKKALDAVHGVDINPYAVAIARFRLTLAFLEKGGYAIIGVAPELPINVVVADSLLHGRGSTGQTTFAAQKATTARHWLGVLYDFVDERAAKTILAKQYTVVVGNPPYITVKDSVLREEYRQLYPRSAAGEYSLGAPFTERFFEAARKRGFIGMITANSFMKREFGKAVIKKFLPTIDLTLIVNTSGAYIPGHGTPTILLFGRHQAPQRDDVLCVLAKRGEPSTPEHPEMGLVWRSIEEHWEEAGYDDTYISSAKIERTWLDRHPWILAGGGAIELVKLIEGRSSTRLDDVVDLIGYNAITRENELYELPLGMAARLGLPSAALATYGYGEAVRDWFLRHDADMVLPYDRTGILPLSTLGRWGHLAWRYRAQLWRRRGKGFKTKRASGGQYYEYSMFYPARQFAQRKLAFAFVSTHNHFVLDWGGVVFDQSAPIIKLRDDSSEDDTLALLGYLNSSLAQFWCRQVMANRGYGADSGNARITAQPWEDYYEYAGGLLGRLPVLPNMGSSLAAVVPVVRMLLSLAAERERCMPRSIRESSEGRSVETCFIEYESKESSLLAQMCRCQEELDWIVYDAFGLLGEEDRGLLEDARDGLLKKLALQPPVDDFSAEMEEGKLSPGHRPFEVLLSRRGLDVDWFQRTGYGSLKELSSVYSESLVKLMEARVSIMAQNPRVALVEQPEYKRRWTVRDWRAELALEVKHAFLQSAEDVFRRRSESVSIVQVPKLVSDNMRAGSVLADAALSWPNWESTISEWIAADAVPYLAAWRHTQSGMEKRAVWERAWHQQRQEDAGVATNDVAVAAKYEAKDYRTPTVHRLRDKLDTPKERFISYPGCESDEDKSPVYGWAGWNHLQQAIALATLYLKRKQDEAWANDRLVPMLAGLDELLPWIWQWHPDPTPEAAGVKPGQYIADFLSGQCHELGVTLDEVRAWRPGSKKKNGVKTAKAVRATKKSRVRTEEETP